MYTHTQHTHTHTEARTHTHTHTNACKHTCMRRGMHTPPSPTHTHTHTHWKHPQSQTPCVTPHARLFATRHRLKQNDSRSSAEPTHLILSCQSALLSISLPLSLLLRVSSALCSRGREENGRLIWGLYSRVSDSEAPVWAGAREFGSDFRTSSPPFRRLLCRSAL